MRPVLRLLGLRLLYFLLVFGVLTVAPLGLDLVLRVLIAFVVSMVLSFFLLRRERLEVTEKVVTSVDARRERRRQSGRG
jgi:dipeptide/tripeptide permease